MTLRDRLRKRWRPAQWEGDHPAERKQREQPNEAALGGSVGEGAAGDDWVSVLSDWARKVAASNFKKPR
jgi:hypothetical protein